MQKEKSIGRNILIVVLILVTIVSVCAGLFAWAKYQTTINGTATGETAKWSFKVSDGDTSTQEIEFPITRTDSNTSVAEGKIAPGTYGEIEIGIDATGTETALTYVIEGTTENKPTNLKFYSDEERTLELTILDNKFSKGGYMKLNEVGTRTEKIYWEWPFETGMTDSVINKNDEIDLQDSGKTMSMKVSVTGTQLNGEPRLADLVQVGDYVNYNASSNGAKTYTSADWLTGSRVLLGSEESTISTDEVFNSSAKAQWRVLSVDRNTGKVELMSTDPTEKVVELSGGDGFVNAEKVLNNIGAIYGQGKGAVSGRSIKVEDVEQYSTYDEAQYVNGSGFKCKIGDNTNYSNSYVSGKFYTEITDEKGNVIDYSDELTTAASGQGAVTMTQTSYWYNTKNDFNYVNNTVIYNMLFCNTTSNEPLLYWLASRCVYLDTRFCYYYLHTINNNRVHTSHVYFSSGEVKTSTMPVVPVVELQSNIQTTGQDSNGVWQLKVN